MRAICIASSVTFFTAMFLVVASGIAATTEESASIAGVYVYERNVSAFGVGNSPQSTLVVRFRETGLFDATSSSSPKKVDQYSDVELQVDKSRDVVDTRSDREPIHARLQVVPESGCTIPEGPAERTTFVPYVPLLPFEAFLLPRKTSNADGLGQVNLMPFATQKFYPELSGNWAYGVASKQSAEELQGACDVTDGSRFIRVAGSLSRACAVATGSLLESHCKILMTVERPSYAALWKNDSIGPTDQFDYYKQFDRILIYDNLNVMSLTLDRQKSVKLSEKMVALRDKLRNRLKIEDK